MRLTLRTLLAYLDSNLPSDQSVELESKIKQSEAAQQLIARIREVQGRVRLGAPSIHGRGTGGDPNSVAEYLDNRLRSEKTTEIEKICIESDMQLAEVAACHQILSQVLGKPLQSPHELRARLYGIQDLVINEGQPHPDADFVRPATATNGAVAAASEANSSHGAWYYVLVGALSLSITLVLLAGGTYLLGGFSGGDREEIADERGDGTNEKDDDASSGASGTKDDEETVIVPVETIPPAGDGDAPEEGPVAPPEAPGEGLSGAAGEEPRITVENGAPPAPTTTPTEPETSEAPPAPATTPTETPAAPPTLEVAAPGPIGVVAEGAGAANLVAIFDPQNVDASRVPIDGKVVAGEEYVTFPLFESDVYASPFHFRFLGDSHWGFTAASGDAPLTLHLDQGTVRIVADQPATLNVRLNGHVEPIRFEEPGTELAVRNSISRFPGDDPRSVLSPHVSDYYLIKGKATLGSATPPLPLEAAKPMRWTEGVGIAAVDTPPAAEPSPAPPAPVAEAPPAPTEGAEAVAETPAVPAMPEWVEAPKESLEEKAAADILASLPADRSLKLSLTEIAIGDDREEVQAIAARSLCSLQYFDAALDSFRDPEQKSYWRKTLKAIRRNAPLSQESAAALRTAVENKFPADSEIVWSMLLGYSPDQLAGRGAPDLVGALEHPDLAVRVLAFLDLWEITDITHTFRPEVVENRRRSAVIRWQGTLRNGDVRYLHPPVAAQAPQESEDAAPPPPTEGATEEPPAPTAEVPAPAGEEEPTIVEEGDAPPPPTPGGAETAPEEEASATESSEAPPLP